MSLEIVPMYIGDARTFVERHHRHHPPPQGGLFAVGAASGGEVIGVAIVGRPVARRLQDGWTAEVTRLCVLDNQPNACSMLFAACWRAARALVLQRRVMRKHAQVFFFSYGPLIMGDSHSFVASFKIRPRVTL